MMNDARALMSFVGSFISSLLRKFATRATTASERMVKTSAVYAFECASPELSATEIIP